MKMYDGINMGPDYLTWYEGKGPVFAFITFLETSTTFTFFRLL